LEVPVEFNLTDCEWKSYNEEGVKELESYEFYSLVQRIRGKTETTKAKKKENNNLKLF
jgi:hypothetical protein